jgi:signal transduction histidine kinase
LYRVTAAIHQVQSQDPLLAQALALALEAVRCAAGQIYVLDTPLAAAHLTVEHIATPSSGQPPDDGTWARLVDDVLAKNEPVLMPMGEAPTARPAGIYVAARIRAGEQLRGVLCAYSAEPGAITVEEMSLLEAIGERIGLALENLRLQSRSRQLAVLQERQRLARDLHDSVTQQVFSLLLFASRAQKGVRDTDLGPVGQQVRRIEEVAQQALKELRLLIFELGPLALAQVGLTAALRQRLASVEKRMGLTVRFHVMGEWPLPSPTEEGLYYIAVEALNNSLKHAAASEVSVSLSAQAWDVTLEVADNGRGFVPEAEAGGGNGLTNMRTRAEKLGATLAVRSAPGEGTTIRMKLEVKHA